MIKLYSKVALALILNCFISTYLQAQQNFKLLSSIDNSTGHAYQLKQNQTNILETNHWSYELSTPEPYPFSMASINTSLSQNMMFVTPPKTGCGFLGSGGISGPIIPEYIGIAGVKIGLINSVFVPTQFDQSTYYDHAEDYSTTASLGATLSISITGYNHSTPALHRVAVYVDYENDGTFGGPMANAAIFGATSGTDNIFIGSFTIPTTIISSAPPYEAVPTVTNTPLRMRIVATGTSNTTPPACASGLVGLAGGFAHARDFSLNISASPLPVDLVSFKANLQTSNTVAICWQTASELNSQSFIVERSQTLGNFEPMGVLKAKGNASQTNNYELEDSKPHIGQNYYRLKSVDIDGSYKYSRPVGVWVEDPSELITVFPNPSEQRQFNVQLSNAQNANFTMSNALGQEISIKTQAKNQNSVQISCPSNTPSGNYLLVIKPLNGKESTKKITFE